MREILFRGKRTDNGEWVEGYVGVAFTIDENKKVKTRHFTALDCLGWSSQVIVSDETIGQYTGLKDKNDRKIFEGDVVKHYNAVYEISYITKYARFAGRNSGCIFAGIPLGNTEVIGNIHDNPELLKGGADE